VPVNPNTNYSTVSSSSSSSSGLYNGVYRQSAGRCNGANETD